MMEQLRRRDAQSPLFETMRDAYQKVVAPSSHFQVALGFNDALTGLYGMVDWGLVLVLDEFDEPLEGMPGRVFLNLRALKDRYRGRLCYVTATNRRLPKLRHQHEVLEFCELFGLHTRSLGHLSREDAWPYVQDFAQREGVTFDEHDFAFIYQQAGGHPGLTRVVCRDLGRVTGEPLRDASQDWLIHREVRDQLLQAPTVRAECICKASSSRRFCQKRLGNTSPSAVSFTITSAASTWPSENPRRACRWTWTPERSGWMGARCRR